MTEMGGYKLNQERRYMSVTHVALVVCHVETVCCSVDAQSR